MFRISGQRPPLILGGNVFGADRGRGKSFRIMDAFLAGGGTMIDTDQLEELLGSLDLYLRRDQLALVGSERQTLT